MDYRKDRSPEETVNTIMAILKNLNIDITITNEKSHKDYWWSLKVEMRNHLGVSTNGKGCTRMMALASGLAEFMERLQAGMLIEKVKTNDMVEYCNLLTHDTCIMSNDVLKIMCGTNGLASGNTVREAICQGFFEVIERYVVKQLFLDLNTEKIGVFDKKLFLGTDAYTRLVEIEKNGLLAYVIDGTCGGMFPVLGVIVINPKLHTYIMSMAADFDVNICLNRCITELFQGRAVKDFFNERTQNLNPIFNSIELDEEVEFYKQITISRGSLPCNVLYKVLSNTSSKDSLKVFVEAKTNDECYELIKSFCDKYKLEVYICDLSFTSFYTCRVYIPGYSEVFICDVDTALEVKKRISKVKEAIAGYNGEKADIDLLKNTLIDLLPYKLYDYQFLFYRLIPKNMILHPELFSDDIMYVLSMICLYQKDIDSAIMYAKKSYMVNNKNHVQFLLWYLEVKKGNTDYYIDYWYNENNGIHKSIDVFERIYENSVDLLCREKRKEDEK